jgi:alpha,alpha-trehalase
MENKYLRPDEDMKSLFTAVQSAGIFADSKSFADAIPRRNAADIEAEFLRTSILPDFNLKLFVEENFNFWHYQSPSETNMARDIDSHIENLWQELRREDSDPSEVSSKIPLPYPYIVPGGRFNEIYYWDSYFTILGLLESGHVDTASDMVKNFLWLVDQFGHIPNGNRSYYLSRSQPPFLSLMLGALTDGGHWEINQNMLRILQKEYDYWTTNSLSLNIEGKESLFFYYSDAEIGPRPESWKEDVELNHSGNASDMYRHLRAACASGWDFSSRWCADPMALETIRTADIIPVDLNCLIYGLEIRLAAYYQSLGQNQLADRYSKRANHRKSLIQSHFFNQSLGMFDDLDKSLDFIGNRALSGFFPLFIGIATNEQASSCANIIKEIFLQAGGLVTTDIASGQQWDAPNGWAPLQYIAVKGLKNYGYEDLAADIMHAWCAVVEDVYSKTGKIMEKYNVVAPDVEGGGGEYPNQDGFGWTNAVYVCFNNDLKKR